MRQRAISEQPYFVTTKLPHTWRALISFYTPSNLGSKVIKQKRRKAQGDKETQQQQEKTHLPATEKMFSFFKKIISVFIFHI